MNRRTLIENPYRPGAGHVPPFLAGREDEQMRFKRAIHQTRPSDNFLITGLRGFGKTVLLDRARQIAEQGHWIWVGNDLSESSSLSEERLALRILTDLAHTISAKRLPIEGTPGRAQSTPSGATRDVDREQDVFATLKDIYERAPGLPSDRLKAVLNCATSLAARARATGIILAYDEAQCLSDHAERNEFPMSMLVETIGALQKISAAVPIMLVLCGLPQVQDALTETRTYTERMFQVLNLDRLSRDETRAAIANPIATLTPPLHAPIELIEKVVDLSGGYPYLIQFFGKELVEKLLENGGMLPANSFPDADTIERLDAGLFGARWNKTTDKQREFLGLLACRPMNTGPEFSAQEISHLDPGGDLSNAYASQMLQSLCDRGLIYRARRGRFAFTVPMSEIMISRRLRSESEVAESWAKAPDQGASATDPARKRWRWFS
jgi:hypothetical protein